MRRVPEWARRRRGQWQYVGAARPAFALEPGAAQESVWDYPRPPAIVGDSREVIVAAGDVIVARTTDAVRVLETASPPTFYLPAKCVDRQFLITGKGTSLCEWKGQARYWSVSVPGAATLANVAWDYPEPLPGYEQLAGYFGFYPAALECSVAGERVRPQAGGSYGGWVTDEIVGPMKGDPGTAGW